MFSVKLLSTRVSTTGFNFSLDSGEILFVSGASGSGKSVLLRALADLDGHGGQVFLGEREQSHWCPSEWRRKVTYCPAESAWWHETVGEHFAGRVDNSMIQQLGFTEEVMQWKIDRLSSGEKQRLGLLRVLAQQPKVVLLDEPTANLDETNVLATERVLDTYRLQTGAIFIWVSHSKAQQLRFEKRTDCQVLGL